MKRKQTKVNNQIENKVHMVSKGYILVLRFYNCKIQGSKEDREKDCCIWHVFFKSLKQENKTLKVEKPVRVTQVWPTAMHTLGRTCNNHNTANADHNYVSIAKFPRVEPYYLHFPRLSFHSMILASSSRVI